MIGALGVFTYANLILTAVGVIALFCVKKATNVIFMLMSAFCVLLGFFALTAQPAEYTGAQMLGILALIAVAVALVLRFILKKSVFFAKLLLCGSVLVSLLLLFG